MNGSVIGHLELMIQNLRAERDQLEKKCAGLVDWGGQILANFERLAAEADELRAENERLTAFIVLIHSRVRAQGAKNEETNEENK
jgi:hypothetical protein